MFSKVEQQLILRGLDHLQRNCPFDVAELPKYWLDLPEDFEPMAAAVRELHKAPELPWPAYPCVLIGPAWERLDLMDPVLTPAIRIIVLANSHPEFRGIDMSPLGWIDGVGRGNYDVFVAEVIRNEVCMRPVRMSGLEFKDESAREACITSFAAMVKRNQPTADTTTRFAMLPQSGTHIWLAFDADMQGNLQHGGFPDIWAVSVLAAKACPCHYSLRVTIPGGFGPVKKRKPATELFVQSRFDRLYRAAEGDEHRDREISPHHRCGHWRYFWKEAGIDRNELPARPLERIGLIEKHRVQHTYVRPAWVGQREGVHQGVKWNLDEVGS